VRSTLRHLSSRQRQLLIMKYIHGYSHSEISKSLGIKEASACRALHRAKIAFKQAYIAT
jgi:RNA polymerase sigma factor (sigma-70 family)